MVKKAVIYHNPRCSKSRQALNALEEKGVEITIIEYLKTPPLADELKRILNQLKLTPRDIIRKKEAVYQTLSLDDPHLSDEQLIQAMVKTPKLIERPIVILDEKIALVARPIDTLQDALT